LSVLSKKDAPVTERVCVAVSLGDCVGLGEPDADELPDALEDAVSDWEGLVVSDALPVCERVSVWERVIPVERDNEVSTPHFHGHERAQNLPVADRTKKAATISGRSRDGARRPRGPVRGVRASRFIGTQSPEEKNGVGAQLKRDSFSVAKIMTCSRSM